MPSGASGSASAARALPGTLKQNQTNKQLPWNLTSGHTDQTRSSNNSGLALMAAAKVVQTTEGVTYRSPPYLLPPLPHLSSYISISMLFADTKHAASATINVSGCKDKDKTTRITSAKWWTRRRILLLLALPLGIVVCVLVIVLPVLRAKRIIGPKVQQPEEPGHQGIKTRDGLSRPWYPSPQGGTVESWAESYRKAQELVNKMTLLEKVNITTGIGWQMGLCVGNTGPATLVGFPSLCLQDGPLGVRFAENISAFPAGVTVAATWSRDLMYRRGFAHGKEARLKGINVLLGPVMGPIGVLPAAGRNWEGFGSDPVLQAVAAAETIRGIQDNGVIATAKHYVLNEQEHFRQEVEWGIPIAMSSNVDDRPLREVYVWPFAESVRAGVASVMCSYQMVNNSYACQNSLILNGILKDELGFQGFVQSDWLAQRSGVASALAGLDVSMPGDGLAWADGNPLWGHQLTRAVLNGSVPIDRLNDMTARVVAAWYQLKQDSWPKPPPYGNGGPNFSSWTRDKIGRLHQGSPGDNAEGIVNRYVDAQGEGNSSHGLLAREIAVEGIILLKNDNGFLPLSRDGPNAPDKKSHVGIYGEDAGAGNGPNFCDDRACNQGTLGSGWGSGAVEFPYLISPWKVISRAFNNQTTYVYGYLTNYQIQPEDMDDKDLCLVFANADSGEGFASWNDIRGDRNHLYLQKDSDDLVSQVASGCGGGNGNTVVIIHSVGPVIVESWIDLPGVKAVLLANLPGQESGNALADVLFGDVDASGRLPYTMAKYFDYGPEAGGFRILAKYIYPYLSSVKGIKKEPPYNYPEGYYQAQPPSPAGGGEGGNPSLFEPFVTVNVTVNNTGSRVGKEVVQVYVSFPERVFDVPILNNGSYNSTLMSYLNQTLATDNSTKPVDFPPRVLRNFVKVELHPGQAVNVSLSLTRKDLSFWSVVNQNWVMPVTGTFKVWVGRSSRDLQLMAEY
ncbi:glycosyl hydrolase [Histoplasma capsulatum H143]|uniref:Probable beta-glucosidase E n=1 Tax=Ajellomyces capsulatus (strain H143) TaxID=544712 RepID=C6H670_AJECH|nr:glycosyl hydrolase [Histoplasma capsulatum H143]